MFFAKAGIIMPSDKLSLAIKGRFLNKTLRYARWGLLALALSALALLAWLIHLDRHVAQTFEQYRQAFPSQVFSKPLDLLQGHALSAEKLDFWLEQAGYQRVEKTPRAAGQYSQQGGHYRIWARGFALEAQAVEPRVLELEIAQGQLSAMSHAQRSVMQAQLEPIALARLYARGGEDRERLALADVPQPLIEALLATEDRDFFQHHGVKPSSIARAAWANLRAGQVVQGGSTLTQQLVKNYFLSSERSYARKFIEWAMAMLLERHADKPTLLEAYLNEVFLAQEAGRAVHGFALASQTFFCQPLAHLRLDQWALLVGLVKGPSYYHPIKHPQRALERRNLVLKLMAQQGFISPQQAQQAQARALDLKHCQTSVNAYAEYLDVVQAELKARYPLDTLQKGQLSIYTALDPWLLHQMRASSRGQMQRLEAQSGKDLQMAFVLIDHSQGEVTAILGHDPNQVSYFNRALKAQRSIGSLIKPVIFAHAFSTPDRYRLEDLIEDRPYRLKDERNEWWMPKNFDGAYGGEITFEQALVHSRNIPAVKLGVELGLDEIKTSLKALGYALERPFYPSDLLGAMSLSPWEVSQVYQTFAAGGFNAPLRAVRQVRDAQGQLIERRALNLQEALPRQGIYMVNYLLHQATLWGTAQSLTRLLPERRVAGKTGTTNEGRDAWFAGFDGKYLGVVWVGQDDNGASQLSGGGAAVPIWASVFKQLPDHPLDLTAPFGVCGQPPYWSETECGP